MKEKGILNDSIQVELVTIASNTGIITKSGTRLKKIILIASLAGIGLFINACTAGYVATEPTYIEYSRPVQPSSMHIWIDGDWSYSTHSHSYVQQTGYWTRPAQGRTYVKGQWQNTPKGHQYSKGYWKKEGKQQKRNKR